MSWANAVGFAAPVVALVVAYLGYRRSRRVDAVTEQSGVATETRAGTQQIIEGLNRLIDQVQDDNTGFRDDLKQCAARVEAIGVRLEKVTAERDELRKDLARMVRLHGNGTK